MQTQRRGDACARDRLSDDLQRLSNDRKNRLVQKNREAERRLDVKIEAGDFRERAIQHGAVARLEGHHKWQPGFCSSASRLISYFERIAAMDATMPGRSRTTKRR